MMFDWADFTWAGQTWILLNIPNIVISTSTLVSKHIQYLETPQ